MDGINQALHGPTKDKLKYAGTTWLALTPFSVVGSELTSGVALLAVLAVVVDSEYLLRAFLVLGPLLVLLGLIRLFQRPWSAWWVFLQLLSFIIQGASIWWAWQWHQEGQQSVEDGYAVPSGSPNSGRQGARNAADPFQAYAPPSAAGNAFYQQPRSDQLQQPQHTEHPEGQAHAESKPQNLL